MGHVDSLSPPSELPDIQKWFSSYVYESPELNTGNGFEDCGYSLEPDGKKDGFNGEASSKEREENLEENKIVGKRDVLVDGESVASNGFVLGYSQPLSLSSDSSQPPDIKNWFSSYVYESPAQELSSDFILSEYKESKFVSKDYNAGKSSNGKEENSRESRTWKNNELIVDCKLPPNCVAKCNDSFEDNKYQHQNVSKSNHEIDGTKSSVVLNVWPFKTISEKILEGDTAKNNEDALPKDVKKSCSNDQGFTGELERKFFQEASDRSLDVNTSIGHTGIKAPGRLFHRSDPTEKTSKAEAQTRVGIAVPESNLDFIVTHAGRKQTSRSNDKENDGNDFAARDFISTKSSRSRRVNDENSFKRPAGDQSESLRTRVRPSSASDKDAILRRKVLSETTNFQHSNASESTGKWRCPQKSKPNLGPPLKQLRLEQWVHRS
ncbi:unnamed protein product [Ilex paraguariensis]|uniref:Uncharacterized protein n=1 Tax=Ilex paraguariensis TaxID=185542 RepID=A0ABC8UV87_9AQUA